MEHAEGFILKTTPYGGNRKIVHLFTLDRGYVEGTVTLLNSRKQQLSSMVLCEFEYIPGHPDRIYSISPKEKLTSINFDIEKGNIALLWGELLDTILKKEEQNVPLYRYIGEFVSLLADCSDGLDIITAIFLYRISSILGFRPDINTFKKGRLFCIDKGIFSAREEMDKALRYAGPNLSEAIYRLHTDPIEKLVQLDLGEHGAESLVDIFMIFYEIHLSVKFDRKYIGIIRETITKL